MNDRELLELAAKAAGIFGVYSERSESIVNEDGYWMPLKDDGDALRLSAELGIFVGKSAVEKNMWFAGRNDLDCNYRDSCIRRAIVRAAAAVGEMMP